MLGGRLGHVIAAVVVGWSEVRLRGWCGVYFSIPLPSSKPAHIPPLSLQAQTQPKIKPKLRDATLARLGITPREPVPTTAASTSSRKRKSVSEADGESAQQRARRPRVRLVGWSGAQHES